MQRISLPGAVRLCALLVFDRQREAIVRGYSTLFVPAASLVTQLVAAHAEGRLEDKLLHFSKPKLLVID